MLAALLSWLLPAAVYGNIYSSAPTSSQYGSSAIDNQLPLSFNTPSVNQMPTSFSFDPTGQSPPVFHSYNSQPVNYNNQNNFGFYPNQIAAQAFASAAQFAQQFAATSPAPTQPVVAQIDQHNLAKYSQYLDILQKAYGIQLPGELGQQTAAPAFQQSSYPSATATSYQGGASPYASTYQGQYQQQVVQQPAAQPQPSAATYSSQPQAASYSSQPTQQSSYPSPTYQSQYTGQSSYVPNSQESSYQSIYQPQSTSQTGYSAASVAPAQPYQTGQNYQSQQTSYQVFPPVAQPQTSVQSASYPQPQPQTYSQSSYQPQPSAPQYPSQPSYPTYGSQESYQNYQTTAPAQPQPQYPYTSQVQPQPSQSYGVQSQTAYVGPQQPSSNSFSNQGGSNGVSNYQTAALGNVYSSYTGGAQPAQPQPQPTAQPRPQVIPYVPGSLPPPVSQQPYVHPPLPSVKPTYSTHVGVEANSVVEGSIIGEGEDGFDYYPSPAIVTAPPTRPRPPLTTPRPTLPSTTRPSTTPRPSPPRPSPTRPVATVKPTVKPEMSGTSIQALTQQVRKLPAVLYIDSRSPKAKETETLLRDTYGLPLVSFYVDKIDRPRLVERNLQQLTAHKGLPYLFICGTFIGSEAHIDNYHRNGQIPQLVEYVCGDEKKKKKKTSKNN